MSQQRENIIRKAVKKVQEPLKDYEKSLALIDKHKLPTTYGVLGSDFTHGAASYHDNKIKLKHAYTPKTVLTRSLQRAALGALIGAGVSYAAGNHDPIGILKDTGTAAAAGAAIGAVTGPALFYAAGKTTEHLRQKSLEKAKKIVNSPQPIPVKG